MGDDLSSLAPKSNARAEFISGVLSGLCCSFAFYPFENVEARAQVAKGRKIPSLTDTLRHVWKNEGLGGLYRGLVPTLWGNALNWGLYFSIYNATRTYLAEYQGLVSKESTVAVPANTLNDIISGVVSGAICCLVVNPFWVLKLRLITTPKAGGMTHEMRHIVSSEGIASLWKGVVPSLVGVTDGALQFMVYDQLKSYFSQGTGVMSPSLHMFAGGASRVVAILITYPYQLLRSALQASDNTYTSMGDAIKKIVASQGIKGLYKGMSVNILRQIPPSAFIFLLVEQIRIVAIRNGL